MLVLLPPDSFMEEMRLTLIPHVIDKLGLLIPFVFLPKVLAALCFLRLFVGNDGYVEPPHAIELIIVIGLLALLVINVRLIWRFRIVEYG